MLPLIFSMLIGGGLGALLGYFGKCSSGACPLTANPWRGAVYGAGLGLVFHFLSGSGGSAAMNESTANVKRISQDQFEAAVAPAGKPVVVDFYATWCGPCQRLSPLLDELAGTLTNQIKFVKINVDEAPRLAQRLEIQGVPSLFFFENGRIVDRLVGLPSADTLKTHLAALAQMAGARGNGL